MMRRKKQEIPESIIKGLARIKVSLDNFKREANRPGKKPVLNSPMINLERDMEKTYCEKNCVFRGQYVDCSWFHENRCSSKCRIRETDVRAIGVDGGKIKRTDTRADIALRKRVSKYLPIADSIEKRIHNEEMREKRRKLGERVRQYLQLIESDDHVEPVEEVLPQQVINDSKYKHLKSLV